MGFPAGVLQVQRCEQDLNAPQFVLLGFLQSRQCNQRHKNNHLCKVYKGDCSCGVDYIGETVRNLAVRIAEHSNPAHTFEPAKHLRENPSHSLIESASKENL